MKTPIWLDNSMMALNLISWLDLAHGLLRHGRLRRLAWLDEPAGWEVEQVLRRYHIHPYGRAVYKRRRQDDVEWRYQVFVSEAQSDFAEYLLCCARVELLEVRNPHNLRAWGKVLPASWDVRRGKRALPVETPVEAFFDWLDSLCR